MHHQAAAMSLQHPNINQELCIKLPTRASGSLVSPQQLNIQGSRQHIHHPPPTHDAVHVDSAKARGRWQQCYDVMGM